VKDAKYFADKTDKGWAAEVAIPWASLPDFKPGKGAKMALTMRVNDADTSHARFKIDPADQPPTTSTTDPTSWPLLLFED
jgi:hypothetical protein